MKAKEEGKVSDSKSKGPVVVAVAKELDVEKGINILPQPNYVKEATTLEEPNVVVDCPLNDDEKFIQEIQEGIRSGKYTIIDNSAFIEAIVGVNTLQFKKEKISVKENTEHVADIEGQEIEDNTR